jgi:DNA invertase Pin-like site-specific DNA recombinase
MSPDVQEDACRAYAEAQGWEVVETVRDLDVSGSDKGLRLGRPGLSRIRKLWGSIDVVIFLKIDRLARNVVDFTAFAEEARAHGADLVSVRDGLDLTTPGGRFVANVLAAFAEMEAATISERTRDGLRAVQASGRWSGGPAPYGFRSVDNPDGPGRVLAIHPEEAAFVQEAAERILAGENLTSVVRWANGPDGRPPRRADAWSRVTMRQVLTGSAIAGRVVRMVDRRPVAVLDADGVPVTIPAIITPDESAALRDVLDPKPDARKAGGRKPARLLSGVLTCSSCHSKLQVARRTGKEIIYRCQNWQHGHCAAPVSVSAPAVEDYVTGVFLHGVGDLPAFVRRAEVTGGAAVADAEAAKGAALASLAQAATPAAFARLQAAQVELAEALAAPRETVLKLVPTGRTIAETWEAADIDDRRGLLEANIAVASISRVGKGSKRLNPDRVLLMFNPAHADEAQAPETYVAGRVVV